MLNDILLIIYSIDESFPSCLYHIFEFFDYYNIMHFVHLRKNFMTSVQLRLYAEPLALNLNINKRRVQIIMNYLTLIGKKDQQRLSRPITMNYVSLLTKYCLFWLEIKLIELLF